MKSVAALGTFASDSRQALRGTTVLPRPQMYSNCNAHAALLHSQRETTLSTMIKSARRTASTPVSNCSFPAASPMAGDANATVRKVGGLIAGRTPVRNVGFGKLLDPSLRWLAATLAATVFCWVSKWNLLSFALQ